MNASEASQIAKNTQHAIVAFVVLGCVVGMKFGMAALILVVYVAYRYVHEWLLESIRRDLDAIPPRDQRSSGI